MWPAAAVAGKPVRIYHDAAPLRETAVADGKTTFSLSLHRALGSAADAVTHLNALQHNHAMLPQNIPPNIESARQALIGALYHLNQFASEAKQPPPKMRLFPLWRRH